MDWKSDKLKPSQPFFVLNTVNFKQFIYLQNGISHFYSFDLIEDSNIIAVPDGCIDIVFEEDDTSINCFVTGTVLKVKNQAFENKAGVKRVFGIRFMPGNKPAVLSYKHKELIDKKLDITNTDYCQSFLEKLKKEGDFNARIKLFLEAYIKTSKQYKEPIGKERLVLTIKNMVYENDGIIKISEIADKTGYSERYINKVFIDEMGFSTKTFCKIIQFQRAIEFLNYGAPEKMTDAAVKLGFYDQSQFIKDFKAYSGLTPKKYLQIIKSKGFSNIISETK